MSESMFGDLDIASAHENPFFKPDGIYICELTKADVKTSKNGNKGFTLDYLIVEDEPNNKKGKKIQEWKPIPMPWHLKGYKSREDMESDVDKDSQLATNAERNMSFIKQRLKQLGVPEDMLNSVTPEYLMEVAPARLAVEIRNNNGRENIVTIKAADEGGSSNDPFA